MASNYNPSIISKEWLLKKDIFTEPISNFFHAPPFSLVENESYHLTVDEGKFQIGVKQITEKHLRSMVDIAIAFVRALPETPYRAVGLNYRYELTDGNTNLGALVVPNVEKIRELVSADFVFGATFEFSFGDFKVTLTAKPIYVRQPRYLVGFNFHSDVADAGQLLDRLSQQPMVIEKAEFILRGLRND
ncbi:MAG: hypothetical protein IBX68_12810 [Dehalococcoidia bacterium]|nr:hypothetical protein [Dehalococcoidia bacterium]